MTCIEAALRAWVKDIEPTPKQKEAASRSYSHLVNVLSKRGVGDRIVNCYLSGSYSRNTALRPIADIDVIFVIDPSQWSGAFFGLADKPNPSAVLRSFARVLRDGYQMSSTFTQKRSLRLELDHVHIDCVPAIARPNSDVILIGNHADETWFESSPKRHQAALTAANAENGKLLVPLVKLLKAWNCSLPEDTRVRSFVVETLAVTLFSEVRMGSLEEGLYLFLDFISHFDGKGERTWLSKLGIEMNLWDGMVVPDISGTRSNVAAGIEMGKMKTFKRFAATSRDNLQRAFEATTDAAAAEHLNAAMNR
ncbi:SMODS domain-containing nucleotidyltransferase [Roseateles cavernae]|uniref:SMODS domain-containing nucleotidyltransferase n=1 Tax=Roseateles cavernae TaxID=3153578 RepID=UPI0032E44587